MAGCDPAVGCQTVAAIKEAREHDRINSAVHAERLQVAATAAEGMIDQFSRCLDSINAHNAALAAGGERMSALKDDVDNLAGIQRDHATGPDGMHKQERKLVWGAISGLGVATGYTSGFLLYTHTDEFLKWFFRLVGAVK
jgi:lysozyme family protein